MNKKSLLNRISVNSPFDKEKSDKIFDRIITLVKQCMIENGSFDAGDLGSFEVEHRKMKRVIDYGRKTEILLPPKDKLVFTPSGKLIEKLNR